MWLKCTVSFNLRGFTKNVTFTVKKSVTVKKLKKTAILFRIAPFPAGIRQFKTISAVDFESCIVLFDWWSQSPGVNVTKRHCSYRRSTKTRNWRWLQRWSGESLSERKLLIWWWITYTQAYLNIYMHQNNSRSTRIRITLKTLGRWMRPMRDRKPP